MRPKNTDIITGEGLWSLLSRVPFLNNIIFRCRFSAPPSTSRYVGCATLKKTGQAFMTTTIAWRIIVANQNATIPITVTIATTNGTVTTNRKGFAPHLIIYMEGGSEKKDLKYLGSKGSCQNKEDITRIRQYVDTEGNMYLVSTLSD